MIVIQPLAHIRVLSTLALMAGALFAAGCNKAPDQSDARLTITTTQPSGTYSPGDDVTFRVTVTNAGGTDVSLVTIKTTLDAGMRERSITCSPLGASAAHSGDEECSDFIYMQTLAKGASVTQDIVATVANTATGTVVNSFQASALAGPAAVIASNQATVVDTRGGAYTAFTSDGHRQDLVADFTANALTFGAGGTAVVAPFTPQPLDPDILFDSRSGFLAHRDLLVGTAALGSGTSAFFAARKFVTTVAALDGHAFNAFGIDTPTGGVAASRFESVAFSGSTMQVCADAAPHAVASCPAASLSAYALSVTDGVFTGIDATDDDTVTFQVAQSDSALIFLRAEATSGGHAFRVGLSTNDGIVANRLLGGDTSANWGVMALTSNTLQVSFDLLESGPISTLTAIAGGPAGVVASALGSGEPVWLAEDNDIAVVLGQPGSSQDGLLQVFAY